VVKAKAARAAEKQAFEPNVPQMSFREHPEVALRILI
jgi:hypothetical protein